MRAPVHHVLHPMKNNDRQALADPITGSVPDGRPPIPEATRLWFVDCRESFPRSGDFTTRIWFDRRQRQADPDVVIVGSVSSERLDTMRADYVAGVRTWS